MSGVDRRMLDRIDDKVERATTIVRFAPGSTFSPHVHGGGEEFLVLDGVFQDEHGDFPRGTYVRNPPTSHHTPGAAEGATIFVKLWQFDPKDRNQVNVDTLSQEPQPVVDRPGVSEIALYQDANERVRIECWEAEQLVSLDDHNGLEILVIEGDFIESGDNFGVHSWLRLPADQPFVATAGAGGARVWVKSGHLKSPVNG